MKVQRTYELIAHRGHGSQPENTMLAFRTGLDKGADRIEFDIQKSVDGDYVVIHDSSVDRTTNGTGEVARLTTAELRQLDAGQGEKLPLFSEVIDWAQKNDVALDIEVKHPQAGDEVELAQMVRRAGLRDPWVMSFHADFVEKFEAEAPEINTAVLVRERALFDNAVLGAQVGAAIGLLGTALLGGLSPMPLLGALLGGAFTGAAGNYGLTMHHLRHKDLDRKVDMHIPGESILNKGLVERAHEMGKSVGVYTVDGSQQAQKFLSWGVDAIISNYPERMPSGLEEG